MADVVICFAPENEAAARQLAEAVTRAGYGVWHSDAASPDAAAADAVTDEIGAAKAAIVIWSEAASASEWVRAEANVARGLKKLIQVSVDGRPPPIPFDRAEMISVLTWKGEEDHPAWRGIAAELLALCGPPPESIVLVEPATAPAASPAPVPAEPAAAPVPAAAAPASAAPAAPSKGPSGLLIVLIVALALAALAAGGWYWMRGRAPEPAPAGNEAAAAAPASPDFPAGFTPPSEAQEAAPAPAEPAAEQFNRAATIQGVDHAFVRSTPTGIGFNLARVEAGEVFTTYEQTGDWWRVRTASGRIGYMNMAIIRLRDAAAPVPSGSDRAAPDQAGRTERRPPPRPRGPRIRKENSEVMAAFCQGAGRGTPQCRTFSRSNY